MTEAVTVSLRAVTEADLAVFFEHQQDPAANSMAAFTTRDPSDALAFSGKWDRILSDPSVRVRTVVLDGQVAGHVASFEQSGAREVTYWLGREHWGRGVATQALTQFLAFEERRPLHARAAEDNLGSIRVLEKCGFERVGRESAFANARGEVIEEVILSLA